MRQRVEFRLVDDADMFGFDRVCHQGDGSAVVERVTVFRKENPFATTPERLSTTRGEMPAAGLEKVVGQTDNDNEFTCWVEYRLPGDQEIIHRSADVKLKKAAAFSSTALGRF